MFCHHLGITKKLAHPLINKFFCSLAVTSSFIGALLTRFFLGFVEAAFFPGSLVRGRRMFLP